MSKGPPGKPPAIHIEDEEDDDATEEANPGLTTAHEDSDNPAVEMVKASEEEDNPAVEMEKPSEEEDRPAVAMEKPSEEEDNPTLEGTAPEDDDPTLEGTLKKSKTPMLSIKSKKDEMSLDGSKKSPLTGDISGDLNFEEDIIIRLQKLRQQYETQKLSTKNTALETDQFLDESNINRIIKSVTDNILHHQTTDYEPKHKDPKRYDPEAFSQFTEAAYNIHNGVTVESEKNILTINVPDKGTITADFKKDEKKILFS